jgi:predicted phosphodiesterase
MTTPERGRPRASITFEQIEADRKAGLKPQQIAAKYGVSKDTIERRIREHKAHSAKKAPGKKQSSGKKKNTEPRQSLYARAILSEQSKKADWSATPEQCIEDLRQVQKGHPHNFISRNFYRWKGKYSDSTWNQHFGTFAQFRRSAGLELSRSQHHLEKKIARHAHLDVYRKFYNEEVAPWVGKYEKRHSAGRVKTILVISDVHDLDADLFVLGVELDTARRVQPDVIVFNGDIYDEYEFSRFDKDPRQVNIKARYDFVRERIFRAFRAACPNAQIDFIIGNHEQRILKLLADRSPAMKVLIDLMDITFSQLLGLDEFKINLVCKNDFAAYNAKEMHEEVRRNYKKYFDTVIVNHFGNEGFAMCSVGGHTHRPGMKTEVNEVMGPIWNLTTGSTCKVDAEYNPNKVNAQNSFALVHVDTWKRQALPEHIMFTSEMAVVGGKYYFRPQEEELAEAA